MRAASIMFFAYVGFDAVSTAAQETKDPQPRTADRLLGSLLFCTVFYILVAAGAIGTLRGAYLARQGVPWWPVRRSSPPVRDAADVDAPVCSNEPLAHVLKMLGFSWMVCCGPRGHHRV